MSDSSSLPATLSGGTPTLNALVPAVYDELRQLAHRYLLRERDDHTLNTTGLVHEAYLRLVGYGALQIESRGQFFGVEGELRASRAALDKGRVGR